MIDHTMTFRHSTLVVVPQGGRTAKMHGTLVFAGGYQITIWEQLSTDFGTVVINEYGLEVTHFG